MKSISWMLIFTIFVLSSLQAQEVKPQLLKEPVSWAFERFTLPPVFAPDFPYKGAEELRFSPGMFAKDSTAYFTYAFVAQLDNIVSISQEGISNYLLKYFVALCGVTANDRKLVVDTSRINVFVEKKKGTKNQERIYNAILNVFGVFTDGAPVRLNMEVKVLTDAQVNKTYLIFIASPLAKNHYVWRELYKIQKHFVVPVK